MTKVKCNQTPSEAEESLSQASVAGLAAEILCKTANNRLFGIVVVRTALKHGRKLLQEYKSWSPEVLSNIAAAGGG